MHIELLVFVLILEMLKIMGAAGQTLDCLPWLAPEFELLVFVLVLGMLEIVAAVGRKLDCLPVLVGRGTLPVTSVSHVCEVSAEQCCSPSKGLQPQHVMTVMHTALCHEERF